MLETGLYNVVWEYVSVGREIGILSNRFDTCNVHFLLILVDRHDQSFTAKKYALIMLLEVLLPTIQISYYKFILHSEWTEIDFHGE